MKKVLLFLTTLSVLYGFQYDAKLYVGIGGGIQNESIVEDNFATTSNTPLFGSVKFGYGDIKAYAIELTLNYINNTTNIFSPNDSTRYGLDVALLKAFNFTDIAYPYLKAGFGAGEMSVQDIQTDGRLSYSSFNLATGVFIPVFKNIDMEFAYEYRFTSYESLLINEETVKPHSHINQLYLGLNYRY